MEQREFIRKFYSSLSDSELISVRAIGKARADAGVVAEAETELVRRGNLSYEPEVRLRIQRESIGGKRDSNGGIQAGREAGRQDRNPEEPAPFEML